MRRTVVHLTPGVVAVLDEAELEETKDISLRWHTADRAEPDESGSFVVETKGVHLSAAISELSGPNVEFARREHEYRPPFDRGRLGDRFEQRHESFVEAAVSGRRCRFLSLFAVFEPGQTPGSWRRSGDDWTIDAGEMRATVSVTETTLEVRDESDQRGWRVDLG